MLILLIEVCMINILLIEFFYKNLSHKSLDYLSIASVIG